MTLRFRVPNEEDSSKTTKVEVFFPTDHPIAGVSAEAKPGWDVAIETTKLSKPIHTDDGEISDVVSKVTWSGGSISAGEFDEFSVVAGTLPDETSSLTFKVIQTYAGGDVVRWIDVASGSAQPDHPAPSLTLVRAISVTSAETTKKRTNIALGLALVAVVMSGIAAGIAVSGKRVAT